MSPFFIEEAKLRTGSRLEMAARPTSSKSILSSSITFLYGNLFFKLEK